MVPGLKVGVLWLPVSCEHSQGVSSIVRSPVRRDPPNMIPHGPDLVQPAAFPPRAHYYCDRREDNHAYYADQHDDAVYINWSPFLKAVGTVLPKMFPKTFHTFFWHLAPGSRRARAGLARTPRGGGVARRKIRRSWLFRPSVVRHN